MNPADDIKPKDYLLSVTPDYKVTWDATPTPTGVSFQAHKFTILDAVERCSAALRTDPSEQTEELIVGFQFARILATLPHFIPEATKNGLLPKRGDYVLLGEVSRRKVLLDRDKAMDFQGCLQNGKPVCAWIKVINFEA
jgi:hypothetical protein